MGEYIFTIGGKEFKVDVKEMTGQLATVMIDGKEVVVDIKQFGKKEIAPVSRHVARKSVQPAQVVTTVVAAPVTPTTAKSNSVSVRAPIPGIILKVLIGDKDKVDKGQDIILMEAMKMENRIQASHSGVIAKINVKQDDAVQQDDVLVEIEPS
jgi:biotin carboxyl carrier protein